MTDPLLPDEHLTAPRWYQRPVDEVVDTEFFWGCLGGICMVVQMASFGVPGFAVYSWVIPIIFGLLYTDDAWHLWAAISIISPYFLSIVLTRI